MADLGTTPSASMFSASPQQGMFGSPVGGWTDPRMMLAQQLIGGAADASPVRSWTQELARALSGPVGAYELGKVRDQQMQGYAAMAGIPQQQQPDSSEPGLLGRIGNSVGNFLGMGGPDNAGAATPPGGPSTATAPQMAAPNGSAGAPSVTPPQAMPPAPPTSGAGALQPRPSPTQAPTGTASQAAPVMAPGAIATATNYAQRMVSAGMQSGNFALVQQGSQLLAQIREKQAEAEMTANTDLMKQGQRLNNDGSTTAIAGYNTGLQGTEQAKATGTAIGSQDPAVTAAKIAATNATNMGTAGTDAAKAGMVSNATAMGANAPNVAGAEASKAAGVAQAQAGVRAATEPALAAATATATNAANAGKPLTPEQINGQEQKLSQDFQGTEAYKNHYNAVEGYKNVLTAAQGTDKASDINLIDGMVKMFNPGATVRQATFQNFLEHSQGIPDNLKGAIQTVYGNNAHLAPETRAQLVAQATDRMNASRQLYNPVVSFLSQTAQNQGLNPHNVVPPLIDPITAHEMLVKRGLAQ
jgi:hypothetical protein